MIFKKIWPIKIRENFSTRWLILILAVGSVLLLAAAGQPSVMITAQPRGAPPFQATPTASIDQSEHSFQLPFAEPPGLATWLVGQPYGNTTGAYRQRFTTYGASGGIHFGLDLSAPCGTEIVAIADGVVFAVDGPFGSPPHNLMIDHSDLGYASLYGHLLEAPDLVPGQRVQQGEVIALSGSSRDECPRGAHLHLEIRDLNHVRKYNPLLLIEADWNNLTLVGSSGINFMRNLGAPRQWQTLYDQPEVFTGGPIVNDFVRPWPFDWSKNTATTSPPLATKGRTEVGPAPQREEQMRQTPPVGGLGGASSLPSQPSSVYQITGGNCCTDFDWSADSTEIRFVDQPAPTDPLGVWRVKVAEVGAGPDLVTNRLGVYNQDQTYIAYPEGGLTIVQRLADGERWSIDTQGERVSFTPGGQLLWTVSDSEVSWRSRRTEVWLADLDGSNLRRLAILQRGSPVAWLSAETLLISSRVSQSEDIVLSTLSVANGRLTELIQLTNARDLSLSPAGRYLVYQSRFNTNAADNGLWLLDLTAPRLKPEKLPFFGSYRWRDEGHLVYIPFDPQAIGHIFYEYELQTGQTARLFPDRDADFNLTITNNEWHISPDGRKIALLTTRGTALDGIWVLDIVTKDPPSSPQFFPN
jgi:murein DD-endopeptidase MepM/ murein hydrolase activator NlpD